MPVTISSLTLLGGVLGSTSLALSRMPNPGSAVLWLAGAALTLTGAWKALHLGELVRGTRKIAKMADLQENFLTDWNGSPGRPEIGQDPVPGMPAQVARMKADVHEVKGALPSIFSAVKDIIDQLGEVKAQAIKTDERVTEHRRRSEAQSAVMRQELEARARDLDLRLERRAAELEQRLTARNDEVDQKLAEMAVDRQTLDALRSALHEALLPDHDDHPGAPP